MSSRTEGTPYWLMAIENASMNLSDEMYIKWLINNAGALGTPPEVIKEQLRRKGYQPRMDDYIEGDADVKVRLPTPKPKQVRRKR